MVAIKIRIIVLVVCLFLGFFILPGVNASTKHIQKDEPFPDIRLDIPKDPSYQKELGVSGEGDFGVQDIKADVIVIQIFHSG